MNTVPIARSSTSRKRMEPPVVAAEVSVYRGQRQREGRAQRAARRP